MKSAASATRLRHPRPPRGALPALLAALRAPAPQARDDQHDRGDDREREPLDRVGDVPRRGHAQRRLPPAIVAVGCLRIEEHDERFDRLAERRGQLVRRREVHHSRPGGVAGLIRRLQPQSGRRRAVDAADDFPRGVRDPDRRQALAALAQRHPSPIDEQQRPGARPPEWREDAIAGAAVGGRHVVQQRLATRFVAAASAHRLVARESVERPRGDVDDRSISARICVDQRLLLARAPELPVAEGNADRHEDGRREHCDRARRSERRHH
jgi:hypothetical protein